VEISKDDAAAFRLSLQALTARVTLTAGPEEFGQTHEAFVEYLRHCQEKAHRNLQCMHQEMAAASGAWKHSPPG